MNTQMKEAKLVATEIRNQILSLDQFALMAWRAQHYTAIKTSDGFGLRMTVNGLKHKGIVQVELTSGDVYRIRTINRNYEDVDAREDCFWEDLVTVLDDLIEGKQGRELTRMETFASILDD